MSLRTRFTQTANRQKSAKKPAKLSRLNKPAELSLEEWQMQLRRQFGREQQFGIKNLGDEPVFSEFRIANPQSKSVYRVIIRGRDAGDNYCSCGDFATNTLGTWRKHIEFTLATLETQAAAARRTAGSGRSTSLPARISFCNM